jgi:serine phosphatase RsbU (regulator of sigma subunit)
MYVVMGLCVPFFYDKISSIIVRVLYMVIIAFAAWRSEFSPFLLIVSAEETYIFGSINILSSIILSVTLVAVLNRENIRFEHNIIKQNQKLQAQNEEIEAQYGSLARLNNEISKKNEALSVSNELIEKKNKTIIQSIKYAQRIQTAVLPKPEILRDFLPEHFVFFQPCDIVSGDFYFFKQIDNQILVAAVDCTGHGVPGAFMSMLGVAMLNEITQKKQVYTANEILEELRSQVKNALQQVGKSGEQQDSMDVALCIIQKDTQRMSFAGAYNPCWIFRHTETGTVEFTELEADRQPAGIHLKETAFSERIFNLKSGDVFYVFSDGYCSQFGGENDEKFKKKRLKALLAEIYTLPMSQQNTLLEQKFLAWKGEKAQTDDVTVIGVRV